MDDKRISSHSVPDLYKKTRHLLINSNQLEPQPSIDYKEEKFSKLSVANTLISSGIESSLNQILDRSKGVNQIPSKIETNLYANSDLSTGQLKSSAASTSGSIIGGANGTILPKLSCVLKPETSNKMNQMFKSLQQPQFNQSETKSQYNTTNNDNAANSTNTTNNELNNVNKIDLLLNQPLAQTNFENSSVPEIQIYSTTPNINSTPAVYNNDIGFFSLNDNALNNQSMFFSHTDDLIKLEEAIISRPNQIYTQYMTNKMKIIQESFIQSEYLLNI